RPNRPLTAVPTLRPMPHEPVAEMSGNRRSCDIAAPTGSTSPAHSVNTPASPLAAITLSQIFCTASAVRGVWVEGFHTIVLPHTAAIAAFHAQTATGKLNA